MDELINDCQYCLKPFLDSMLDIVMQKSQSQYSVTTPCFSLGMVFFNSMNHLNH